MFDFWGKKLGRVEIGSRGEKEKKRLPERESTVQVFSSTVLNLVRFDNGFLLP